MNSESWVMVPVKTGDKLPPELPLLRLLVRLGRELGLVGLLMTPLVTEPIGELAVGDEVGDTTRFLMLSFLGVLKTFPVVGC